MHGLINRSIQHFLSDTYGTAIWSEVAAIADAPAQGRKAVAVGAPEELIAEHAGTEAVEVYGSPARLTEVEQTARDRVKKIMESEGL